MLRNYLILLVLALELCTFGGSGFLDLDILNTALDLPVVTQIRKISKKLPTSKKKKKPKYWSRSGIRPGKGEEEMAGFLGVGSLVEPIIILKKRPEDSPVPEPECVRTRFFYPFREDIFFLGNSSIKARMDPVCTWYMIGTEVCVPKLSCPIFNLDANQTCTEYLEVTDGHRGYSKHCGNNAPVNLTATDGLRDLYIKFKSTRWEGSEKDTMPSVLKFNCTISCDGRDYGKPIPAVKKPNVNPFCECGKKLNQDRIINGFNTSKNEFPWLASLVQTNTRQSFCGGAVINDRFILTAGHCIKGMFMNFKNIQILLNANVLDRLANTYVHIGTSIPKFYDPATLARLDQGNGSVRFDIEEIIIHPLYVSETNDFDSALIRLSKNVDFATAQKSIPICLPRLASYLRTFSKANATIAGYGLTQAEGEYTSPILQKLYVAIFPPRRCKLLYAHRINRRMLCAGYEEGGRDSCMGDSGGPLIIEERPQVWTQIGIVSWGEGCATKSNPGVYLRTTEIWQWISYHANSNDAVWCNFPPVSKEQEFDRKMAKIGAETVTDGDSQIPADG